MTVSKKKKVYTTNYNRDTYDQIKFFVRKDLYLNRRITQASSQANKSKAQYMIDAIEKQLSIDNCGIDTITDQQNPD